MIGKLLSFLKTKIKMRNKYWIWMLLFAFQFSFSQLKGVVKDSISGQPIPYVNIWVENENIGTTSEQMVLSISIQHRIKYWFFRLWDLHPKK